MMNDQSEQTIRPLTVGRANWLFLGHPGAAPGRLQVYSIVSSAHHHHLVIGDYLEDVLRRLADAQQNHPADLELGAAYLADLLQDRWALAHPTSVRQERIEEREIVSDAKRGRRAKARMAARSAQMANPPLPLPRTPSVLRSVAVARPSTTCLTRTFTINLGNRNVFMATAVG